MQFVSAAPPSPEWVVDLTDGQLHDMMVEDMLEEERFFEGGDFYVSSAD